MHRSPTSVVQHLLNKSKSSRVKLLEMDQPTGTPPSQDRIEERAIDVCNAVGAFIETWGFRAIHGRVWALLALSDHPLSQSEVAERLGVSRSLVHLAVNELLEFALVRPVGTQRNAPYVARMDVWPTIAGVLRKREWMLMESARLTLETLQQDLRYASRSGQTTGYDIHRVEVLLLMTELAQATLKSLLAIRIPDSVEDSATWLRRALRMTDRLPGRLKKILMWRENP